MANKNKNKNFWNTFRGLEFGICFWVKFKIDNKLPSQFFTKIYKNYLSYLIQFTNNNFFDIMKKMLPLICILVMFNITTSAQKQEVLSNEIVINMIKQGLPHSLIIKKIKSSKNNFDVSIGTLIKLKELKIPEDIMNAMVDVASDDFKVPTQSDLNNPIKPHDPGIYYLNEETKELIELEPSIYSQSKTGGHLAQSFTYGLANVTNNLTLDGSNSRLKIKNSTPIFYFYFDISEKPSNQNFSGSWWFSSATSPNEFLLVNFKIIKNTRSVDVGSSNILGSTSGVSDQYKTDFKFEKLSKGIYKVYTEKPIDGEFCFMYGGNIPSGFTINKVYDFGTKNYNENLNTSKTVLNSNNKKSSDDMYDNSNDYASKKLNLRELLFDEKKSAPKSKVRANEDDNFVKPTNKGSNINNSMTKQNEKNYIDELYKLKQLLDSGLITREEFDSQKRILLDNQQSDKKNDN